MFRNFLKTILIAVFVFGILGFILPFLWLLIPFALFSIPFYPLFKWGMPGLMQKRFGGRKVAKRQ